MDSTDLISMMSFKSAVSSDTSSCYGEQSRGIETAFSKKNTAARFRSISAGVQSNGGEQSTQSTGTQEIFSTIVSPCCVEFRFHQKGGHRLPPKQSIEMPIPKEFSSNVLRNIMLAHRKAKENRSDMSSWSAVRSFDSRPAYTQIEGRFAGTDTWKSYIDDFGNGGGADMEKKRRRKAQPGKFAEPRSAKDPEVEGLHDWQLQACGPKAYDTIRATSVGKGSGHIHYIRCYFYPVEPVMADAVAKVYTPKTEFGDYPLSVPEGTILRHPKYGGGEMAMLAKVLRVSDVAIRGMYPGALVLAPSKRVAPQGLEIPIPNDAAAVYFELSCGDTTLKKGKSLASQKDELGFYGTRQDATVSVRSAKTGTVFLKSESVPPSGIIACYGYNLPIGDKLIVTTEKKRTFVMGYRVVPLKGSRTALQMPEQMTENVAEAPKGNWPQKKGSNRRLGSFRSRGLRKK